MSGKDPVMHETSDIPGQLAETLFSRLRGLEQRNETLQRTNYALMAGLGLTLLIAVVALVNGGRVPAEIEASRYVLKDAAGITRGTWAVLPEGGTNLSLQDRNGVARVRLTLLPEGFPGIALTDGRGLTRAVFGVLPDGTATAVFADAGGNTRAVLGVAADETSHLVFVDSEGNARATLGAAADGDPEFALYETLGRPASPPVPEEANGSGQ